jgi:hypothetical protein
MIGGMDENGADENGFIAYDLAPPTELPPMPVWTPFRPPLPRYTPPPVPEGCARVELDDDYYLGPGWNDWYGGDSKGSTAYPARVFDIPAEQRERWAKAQADYAAMQEEISALRDARLAKPGWAPDGWVRTAPHQAQP